MAGADEGRSGGAGGQKTIRELLGLTTDFFRERGIESARLDAELLLAHALSESRLRLYMDMDRPLGPDEVSAYRELVRRRAGREPVAYIVGEREFYSRPFKVNANVLIPRPDTESVVDALLERLPRDVEGRVVDVGTGSGCIAITVAKERPGLSVIAVDISEEALVVAGENAVALGVKDRVELRLGDLLEPVRAERDLVAIISNPPYIRRASEPELMPDVRDHEPHLALFGGDADGLFCHRALVEGAPALLGPGGLLVTEIGFDQAALVRGLTHPDLQGPELVRDLSGHERGAIWVRAMLPENP